MGREYTNPNTSVIGAIFTGASGDNTLGAVNANGQVLNKTDYPALSSYFNQGQLDFIIPSTKATSEVAKNKNTGTTAVATTSTFVLFGQTTSSSTSLALQNRILFWRSIDGKFWSLCDFVGDQGENLQKMVTINNTIYVCTSSRLLTTTDGITFTTVFNNDVWDVTTNGTIFLIATNTTTLYETTNFVTFTTRTVPVATRNVTWFAGSSASYFWILPNGSTSAYYSTTGTSWIAVANAFGGNAFAATNKVFVINSTLIACNGGTNGASLLWSTTTGAASAFTGSSTTLNMGATFGPNIPLTVAYDGTYYTITGVMNNTSTIVGYRFTTLNGTGTAINRSSLGTTQDDAIVFMFNAKLYTYLVGTISLEQTNAATITISPSGTIAQGYFANPFLNASNVCLFGSTFDGSRYVIKNIADTNYYILILVEVSGVFRPLEYSTNTSTGFGWSPLASASLNLNTTSFQAFLYKDSGGYIFIYNNGTGAFISQQFTLATRTPNTDASNPASSLGGLNPTSYIAIPAKNVGVYIIRESSTSVLDSYLLRTSTPTPGAGTTLPNVNLGYSFSNIKAYCSLDDGTVAGVIRNSVSASSSPFIFVISPTQATSLIPTYLYNASGISVATTNTALQLTKFSRVWYMVDSNIAYSSTDGSVFNRLSVGSSVLQGDPTPDIQIQYSSNTSFSSVNQVAIRFNQFTTTQVGQSTPGMPYMSTLPFPIGSSTSGVILQSCPTQGAYPGITYSYTLNPNTQFKIPNISSAISGQANYIVAR